MGISRIDFGDTTLIDLTNDSVTPESLLKGFTAHSASGDIIVGNYVNGEIYEGKYCWQVFQELGNITPVMTSNSTNGYQAFASTEITEPRKAWCAFDNISGTDQEANRWHGSANDLPGHIGMIFPGEVSVLAFSVKNASNPHYGIKTFELQCSLDGVTWSTVGSYSNPKEWNAETVYTVTNPSNARRYWRLYITDTWHTSGNSKYCIIDEIKFYSTIPVGFVVSDDPNAYPSQGSGSNGLYYVQVGALN